MSEKPRPTKPPKTEPTKPKDSPGIHEERGVPEDTNPPPPPPQEKSED